MKEQDEPPFDMTPFTEHQKAFERNIEKLKTFQPGDRVSKPWFTGIGTGPIVEEIRLGTFISAEPPVDCFILWDGKVGHDLCPVSFIKHAE